MAEQDDCLFCRIADGRLPAEVVRVGTKVLAFRDVNPQAPTHVLVIPKDHHPTVGELAERDPEALAELVTVARAVAEADGDGAHRLVFNSGEAVGQSVHHVHGHVLAGRSFSWPPG
jgi:histidine triad (HIT) family protein